jgi:adenosylmethionine-8-amino-7-oxononanoate aminotransferase
MHVFPRHTKAQVPKAVRGDGCYIVDSNGKRYLDGSSGAAVSCLGHSNRRVTDAIKAQLDELSFAHTGFFTTDAAERLADRLIGLAPEGIDRVYFVSGGSEAVEAALKLARQYHLERGAPQRTRIISRWQSYHGNTLGALAAGGNRWRRAQFAPLLTDAITHIDPCHYWRFAEPGETPFAYGQRVANALETELQRVGPETVAAFIAEPVVGATMGAVPAVEGYFSRIREICDAHGVLLILDEVMCGMGRTGHWFACEADSVRPDIITIAKGLGAGIQPIGAMLCSRDIYEAIETGSGFFQHGHTYLGHAAACAGANAVLDELEERDLIAQCGRLGAALQDKLRARFGQHPNVGDIRGRGLFIGLELVADRETKATFDPARKVHAKLKSAAMQRGLMTYPMGGTIDGEHGDHVLLAPPFIISDAECDELVDKLALSLADVLD